MSAFLRGYVEWLRSLPDLIADRADRWLMDMHQPAWIDDEPAPCRHCKKRWPCELFMDAADRRAEAARLSSETTTSPRPALPIVRSLSTGRHTRRWTTCPTRPCRSCTPCRPAPSVSPSATWAVRSALRGASRCNGSGRALADSRTTERV